MDGSTNLHPLMGVEVLREQYRALLSQIYSPTTYYERVRTFLSIYKEPAVRQGPTLLRLLALAKSVVRLGVIGRERAQYWKLLKWTLTERPRLLPQAVTLAIYGYHFRRVTELHVL